MTVLILCLLFPLPLISIARDLHRDRASEHAEAEIARLTAELPPARADLSEWPAPLSPLDLPGIGATEQLAATELSSRVFRAEPAPIVAELHVGGGRHRAGVATGTAEQQARWNTSTGQFWQIVDGLGDLWEPCTHCTTPEDGEPAHAGCPGCSCPCSLMEVAGHGVG